MDSFPCPCERNRAQPGRAAEDRRPAASDLGTPGPARLPAREERAPVELRPRRPAARAHPDRARDADPREGAREVKWFALLVVLVHWTAVAAQSPEVEFDPHLG